MDYTEQYQAILNNEELSPVEKYDLLCELQRKNMKLHQKIVFKMLHSTPIMILFQVLFFIMLMMLFSSLPSCTRTIVKPVPVEVRPPALVLFSPHVQKPAPFTIKVGQVLDTKVFRQLQQYRLWTKDLEKRVRLYEQEIKYYNSQFAKKE